MAGGLKRLAKETAIYGVGSIVGRFLNWMLVPMYTRILENTGEYGIVTNIYSIIALLMVLLTYGMETGFFRFIYKKEEQEPMRIYASTLYSVAFTSLLFFVGVMIFLQPVSGVLGYASHPEYIGMMTGVAAVDAFCCIPFAYLRYKNRPVRFLTVKLLNIGLNIGLNIFFLVLCPEINTYHPEWISWFYRPDYGAGYIFISNIFTSALTFAMLIPEMMSGFRAKFNLQRLRNMLRYSFPMLILGIAGILNQTADKILFPFLFDDKDYANSQLGIYGACFKIAVVMVMFIQAFRYAYEPFVFSKNKDGNHKNAYAVAMKYFIIFSLIIFIGVIFYLDLLKHFVEKEYYPGLTVVPIVMLGELFFGIYYNLSAWYKLTDKTQWGAWFSITGCIVTVVIIVGYVPYYGFIACAWASFASNLLMMLLSYFVGQKKFPVKYDLRSAFTYVVIAAICYVAGMMPQIDSIFLRLTYRTVIFAVFIGIVIKKDLPLAEIPYVGKYFRK
ncbi:MAG: polysaccharide biosynthesis C-terminal domain-containing protein [Tannerella sp.]|jgi:O-antigen/teichoic acid export membrane protein|nr:polysaccharide biosynthesis C-terminal domain-containing protein [Tannerella sp.]